VILKHVSLTNFRRFSTLDVDFHDKLTVIVARNGQGKSSLLDAATVALGTFVGAFDFGKAKHLAVSDARYQSLSNSQQSEQVFPIAVTARFTEPEIDVHRELTGIKNKTTIKGASQLTQHGKKLMDDVRNLQDVTLPVIAYYGSGRLWNKHTNMQRKSVLSASRSMGYENCLSSSSSFTQVQQWMAKATYAVMQQHEMAEYQNYPLKDQLKGIKDAVNRILAEESWSNFHYSLIHEELAMFHQDHGTLPVSLMSDGVRAMIALTADLAWRCATLNPHLREQAAQTSSGIVFVDEVDMHLHPAWQQVVLQQLQDIFPHIQWIVTTHSPQVLSTVHKESIRVLARNQHDENVASMPLAHSYGEPSNDVLQAIMHVDPQPPVTEKEDLERLTSWVDQGCFNTDEAQRLLSSLKLKLNKNHPQIEKIERSIRRQKALQG